MTITINPKTLLGVALLSVMLFLSTRLSADSLTMVVGILFGILAGLPALALIGQSYLHSHSAERYPSRTSQRQQQSARPQIILTQQPPAQTAAANQIVDQAQVRGSDIHEAFLASGYDCKLVNQVQKSRRHFIYEFIFEDGSKLSDIVSFIAEQYYLHADLNYHVITQGAVIQVHQTASNIDKNSLTGYPPQKLIEASYDQITQRQYPIVRASKENQHAYH